MFKEKIDKKLINYFLDTPINYEEISKLYLLIKETLKVINFEKNQTRLKSFNIEITDDEDQIYKEIKINIPAKYISINLCRNVTEDYFISINITYCDNFDIEISKKLVKTNFPNGKSFRELAIKKWQCNIKGEIIDKFKEIESIDYTENIQCCSIDEIRESEKKYIKCLSKNKK